MTEPQFDLTWLPIGAELLGVARCSEASPQCTSVARRANGDLLLGNQVGGAFVIPAAEVAEVLRLAQGTQA